LLVLPADNLMVFSGRLEIWETQRARDEFGKVLIPTP